MKKTFFGWAGVFLAVCLVACNDANETTATATDTGDSLGSAISREAGEHNSVPSTTATAGTTNTMNAMPLGAADSLFVLKAAAGGMMEIEAGNLARQNAQSERVKNFGAMMVRDHQAASQELMKATGGAVTMPRELPEDKKQILDPLRNLKGMAFDKRYINLMVEDHRKTIADFQKQANGGENNAVKAFAQRTLPVLQMHLDSAVAIHNALH